jgi:hypothetical protein
MLTVTFAPRTAGAPCFQRFTLATPGGPPAALIARGTGTGPLLALSARALEFGDVKAGRAAAQVVYLKNSSDVPAAYEFPDEGGGVFLLSAPRGVVAPRSVAHTRVIFAPKVAANYWRRLVCIVKVGSLVGTCFGLFITGGGSWPAHGLPIKTTSGPERVCRLAWASALINAHV